LTQPDPSILLTRSKYGANLALTRAFWTQSGEIFIALTGQKIGKTSFFEKIFPDLEMPDTT